MKKMQCGRGGGTNEKKHLFEYNGFDAEDGQYIIHFTGGFRIIFCIFGRENDTVIFAAGPNPSYNTSEVSVNYKIKEAGIEDLCEAEFFYGDPVAASEFWFHAIAGNRYNAVNIADNGRLYTGSNENRLFAYGNNGARSNIVIE